MSPLVFDSDHPNATVSGWRYPQFEHDGDRSIVLVEGYPKGVLSYVISNGVPYVLQIQGVHGERPPRNWTKHLLAHLVERSEEVIVRSARNNPYARAFHRWLASNDVYRNAGLGDVRFAQAMDFDARVRARLDGLVETVLATRPPDEDSLLGAYSIAETGTPRSRLHPSTAYMRYDVTAHNVARRLKKRLEELDEERARAFGVAPADLCIR